MSDVPAAVIPLSGSLVLRDAARLATELSARLATPGSLSFDCAGIDEVDLAGVQLLLAAGRTAAAARRQLTVSAPLGTPLAELLAASGFVPSGIHSDHGIWTITEARAA